MEGVGEDLEGSSDMAEDKKGCVSVTYGLSLTITVLRGTPTCANAIYLNTGRGGGNAPV